MHIPTPQFWYPKRKKGCCGPDEQGELYRVEKNERLVATARGFYGDTTFMPTPASCGEQCSPVCCRTGGRPR